MTVTYYDGKNTPKKGDIFQTTWIGQCRILETPDAFGNARVQNVVTGELFDACEDTFLYSDLIERE